MPRGVRGTGDGVGQAVRIDVEQNGPRREDCGRAGLAAVQKCAGVANRVEKLARTLVSEDIGSRSEGAWRGRHEGDCYRSGDEFSSQQAHVGSQ